MATPIVPIDTLPPAPSRAEPATFANKSDALLGALDGFVSQTNAIATATNANAAAAESSADAAAISESAAITAQGIAQGAANYAGVWSTLTGALNIPASTYHSGRMWVLLSDVANVTASEPGVSADWSEIKHVITYQEFTSSGTWTKPAGCSLVYVQAIQGGESGAASSSGANTAYQEQGGRGGAIVGAFIPANTIPSSVSVTVGAGGAARQALGDGGIAGAAGGSSSFGGFEATGHGSPRAGSGGIVQTFGILVPPTSALPGGTGGAAAWDNNSDITAGAGQSPGGGGGMAAVLQSIGSAKATSGAGGAGVVRVWAW